MDSLLASYGSDHDSDDDEEPKPLSSSAHQARPSLSSSLPPPHSSAPSFPASQGSQANSLLSTKNSLFASLPPPKLPSTSILPADSGMPIANRTGPLGHAQEELRTSNGPALAFSSPGPRESRRSSLFSSLLPPRSVESSAASLVPSNAQQSGDTRKRVVKFTPAVNRALLENPEVDDEPHRKKRRADPDTDLSAKGSGLAAILPRPKNLGATLGGGTSGGGRRAALETSAHVSVSETRTLETAPSLGNSTASDHVHGRVGQGENSGHFGEGIRAEVDAHGWSTPASTRQVAYSRDHDHHSNSFTPERVEPLASEHYLDFASHQNQGLPDDGASNADGSSPTNIGNSAPFNADVAIASMMIKEKRRGNKEVPPNVVELRQADLTGTKVREDQLRTTGIAFGPAYKPVSSNKDKPSKLHRRKHQIGSLLFDMKQKELELLERRAKGNLTKAETQAKYGW